MERGLHLVRTVWLMLVVYYQQIEHQKGFELRLHVQKWKETPAFDYGRMPGDFRAVDNPKHKLLLLIG
jgi:hypothetical protein